MPIFQQVQEFDLGAGASCQVADVRFGSYRFLLVNLKLCGGFWFRPQQLHRLFGPDIFQRIHFSLPCLLVGDFFDGIWLSIFNPLQKVLNVSLHFGIEQLILLAFLLSLGTVFIR